MDTGLTVVCTWPSGPMVSVALRFWLSLVVKVGGELSTEFGCLVAAGGVVQSQQSARDQGAVRRSGASTWRKVSPLSEEQQDTYLHFAQLD